MRVEGAEDFEYMIMLPPLVLLLGWYVVFISVGLVLPAKLMIKTSLQGFSQD